MIKKASYSWKFPVLGKWKGPSYVFPYRNNQWCPWMYQYRSRSEHPNTLFRCCPSRRREILYQNLCTKTTWEECREALHSLSCQLSGKHRLGWFYTLRRTCSSILPEKNNLRKKTKQIYERHGILNVVERLRNCVVHFQKVSHISAF